MKGEQQQIKKAAEEIGAKVGEGKSDSLKATLKKATTKGTSPKDVLGLTDAMVEGIYGQAYRLYNTGKYKEAIQIFRMLLMINSTEPKYALGLAACLHMKKEYSAAVAAYTLVSTMDPLNPIPFYHTADCFIKMADPFSAILALEAAIKKSGEKPEYKTLKDRATLMLEGLKKDVAKATQAK